VTRLALEFLILTIARSGEVRRARWSEIDLADRVWLIPAERTDFFERRKNLMSDWAAYCFKF
jgi:integrase